VKNSLFPILWLIAFFVPFGLTNSVSVAALNLTGSCISKLPLARKIYLTNPNDLLALQTIAECTQSDQNIDRYASGAKEIFEQSKILSIVPHLLEMAQIKELVPILKEVEVKKEKSLNDYLMLNEIYERLGEPEKQITALKEAIQLSPGDPRPLLLLAAKKLDAGEREEALNIFKEYITKYATNTNVFEELQFSQVVVLSL
jgi:tetratricopeptide (TPR) repeat protein